MRPYSHRMTVRDEQPNAAITRVHSATHGVYGTPQGVARHDDRRQRQRDSAWGIIRSLLLPPTPGLQRRG
jgi:hypothetical protein